MTSFNLSELWDRDRQIAAAKYAVRLIDGASPAKPLVIVFGNGVIHLNFFRKETLAATIEAKAAAATRAGKRMSATSFDIDQEIWRLHETLRDHSQNYFPSIPLLYLLGLMRLHLVRLAFTPNYDLFFNSLLEKSNLSYTVNPIGALPDVFVDEYGPASKHHETDHVDVWKYHGDVGYVRFPSCGHVFRLPRFSIQPNYAPSPRSQTLQLDAGVPSLLSANQRHYMHGKYHSTGWPQHYIDFNYDDKAIFASEINGALTSMKALSPQNVAGILIVGFAGRWADDDSQKSEEIVPDILAARRAGISVTMIFRPSETQHLDESHLAQGLWAIDPLQVWAGDATDNMRFLIEHCPSLRPLKNEDRYWMNRRVFMMPPRFK